MQVVVQLVLELYLVVRDRYDGDGDGNLSMSEVARCI